MCLKCDGYSDEAIARGVELIIATNGWMVQGVEGSDGPNAHKGFSYTIGATASYGLPELVVMDIDYRDGHTMLNWAVEFLRDGGSVNDLPTYGLEWATVHDDLLDSGLFGTYTRHYGKPPEPGWVVQLFAPDGKRCATHVRERGTDLSDPFTQHPYSDDEL